MADVGSNQPIAYPAKLNREAAEGVSDLTRNWSAIIPDTENKQQL